MTTLLLIAGD